MYIICAPLGFAPRVQDDLKHASPKMIFGPGQKFIWEEVAITEEEKKVEEREEKEERVEDELPSFEDEQELPSSQQRLPPMAVLKPAQHNSSQYLQQVTYITAQC